MRFPRRERVIYQRNPLSEVICQVRVPRILALDAQVPFGLQDLLRQDYPLLEVGNESVIQVTGPSAQPIASPFQRTYTFRSDDKKHHVSLTGDFIALSTSSYERWEHFRDRVRRMLEAFAECYGPIRPLRLGLRYQDVIDPQKFELGTAPWTEWINSEWLGLLAIEPWALATQHLSFTVLPLEDDKGQVTLRSGLVGNPQSGQTNYVIDADFSAEPTPARPLNGDIAELLGRLDEFNQEAGGLFRACITEELHGALQPRPA
jgi:uncharacterized protein (TIGR04255 family)